MVVLCLSDIFIAKHGIVLLIANCQRTLQNGNLSYLASSGSTAEKAGNAVASIGEPAIIEWV